MSHINVTINGRQYRMACEEGQEVRLLKLAENLQQRVESLRGKFGEIGDARLTFAKEPDGVYDLIIVDAYSSDAIPIHLATEEAMAIYKAKLAPQGAVVMHVSNRHLELESVVVGIADANDMKSWVYNEDSGRDDEYIFSTDVVVSAREEADVGKLASSDKWTETEPTDGERVWTDDYSNILGAVYRRLRDGE